MSTPAVIFLLVAFSVLIALKWASGAQGKGWLGEKTAAFSMGLKLDPEVYRRVDNIILPAGNGKTQIDHVIVSIYGLFVIETKNMNGWIFGSADEEKWTQRFRRKSIQFQNPLRQNYRHTCSLSEFLGLDRSFIHSVVFFVGDAQLKTALPDNVLTKGFSAYIKRFNHPVLPSAQVAEIERRVRDSKELGLSRSDHLKSLNRRYASVTACPKCGGDLVKRTAGKGANFEKAFYGCSNYPKCRYIKTT